MSDLTRDLLLMADETYDADLARRLREMADRVEDENARLRAALTYYAEGRYAVKRACTGTTVRVPLATASTC